MLQSPDGTHYTVSKVHAFAVLSGHPRSSKDRSLRVHTMARFVSVQPAEIYEHCSADPDV